MLVLTTLKVCLWMPEHYRTFVGGKRERKWNLGQVRQITLIHHRYQKSCEFDQPSLGVWGGTGLLEETFPVMNKFQNLLCISLKRNFKYLLKLNSIQIELEVVDRTNDSLQKRRVVAGSQTLDRHTTGLSSKTFQNFKFQSFFLLYILPIIFWRDSLAYIYVIMLGTYPMLWYWN